MKEIKIQKIYSDIFKGYFWGIFKDEECIAFIKFRKYALILKKFLELKGGE